MNNVPYVDLVAAVRALSERPTAFVLGSGLGSVATRINIHLAVGFADIPGMVAPTVSGHGGTLALGAWAGHPALLFTGRLHYYEGNSWPRVVRPMEVLGELGAKCVVLTNAAGGIADAMEPGSLMALDDHLEWNQPRCWNIPGRGERASPYSAKLNDELAKVALQISLPLHHGVYAAVTGPVYESPAEIRRPAP